MISANKMSFLFSISCSNCLQCRNPLWGKCGFGITIKNCVPKNCEDIKDMDENSNTSKEDDIISLMTEERKS